VIVGEKSFRRIMEKKWQGFASHRGYTDSEQKHTIYRTAKS